MPRLKAWPVSEGYLIVIPVLSLGQMAQEVAQFGQAGLSLEAGCQRMSWRSAGLGTDRADPASRIGSQDLGERPAAPSFPKQGGGAWARQEAENQWSAAWESRARELGFRIGKMVAPEKRTGQ